MIKHCKCPSKGQDELHGKEMRVCNKTAKQDGQVVRCTICGAEHKE